MKNWFNKISILSLLLMSFIGGYAQDEITLIHTAVPSMSIAPDARGGGMGDLGAATLPDVYSQYWNPSKYAFAYSKAGLSFSYTPWLRKLVNDIALMQAVGYYKLGEEDNQALSASIRYFSVGSIDLNGPDGASFGSVSPHEYAFDIGYSRKLSETFSGGVTFRYIRTDYSTGQDDSMTPGNAFAADISGYNESYVMVGEVESLLGIGFNLSNIGTKISTDGGNTQQFIPANLRIGGSLTYPLDDYNSIAFNADLSKVLVPAAKKLNDKETDDEVRERYSNMSPITGVFKSFDNLTDVSVSIGAEYAYNNQFFLRGGYYYETERLGNRKYLTAGAGFKMSSFQIDAAYLLSSEQNSPLDQTIRFSLSFDMDGLRNLGR